MGKRAEKEEWLVELVGDQNPGPEAPFRSKRGGRKRNVRGGVIAREVMEKNRYIRVIVREGGQKR